MLPAEQTDSNSEAYNKDNSLSHFKDFFKSNQFYAWGTVERGVKHKQTQKRKM